MGKVLLPILKELEHQARQNISTLNFTAAFAKTSSSCNATLEKCQHSLKSTFKRIKSQIQKGANSEKAAKRGYEQACEYLDLWNKTVLIQHRAVTCLSKSLAHILQRELYTMGNTGLLRHEAEMTLLQPQLGEMRRQELRNSPFWHSSLFKSQLVKEGEDFLLKKGTSKNSQGYGPYKPFRGSHSKKRGSYRKCPRGATPHKAVTNRFPQVGGNRTSEAPGVVFDPTTKGEGVETPPPNDSLKASLNPPVGGRLHSFRRDWQTNKCSSNVLNIITNSYVLPFLSTKSGQIPSASVRIQALSKRPSSGHLYPVSSVKECNQKGGKCRLFLVPKVEAGHRPKQAQHFSTCRKVQNGNSRVHQDLPDYRGMGIVDRPIGRLPSHPHPSKLKEIPKVLLQVQCSILPPSLSD